MRPWVPDLSGCMERECAERQKIEDEQQELDLGDSATAARRTGRQLALDVAALVTAEATGFQNVHARTHRSLSPRGR